MPSQLYPQGRVIQITFESITKFVYKYPCEMKTLDRQEIDEYLNEIRYRVIRQLEEADVFKKEEQE